MNPGDSIARIRDRLVEKAQTAGLELVNFNFIPGKVEGTHGIQAMFRIKDKDEKAKINIQIEQIESGEAQSEQDAKFLHKSKAAEETLRDLERKAKDPKKGILDD
jgi:hypothetical protein